MTVIDSKQLNKLWAKSTDLNSPQRARHLYDLAFFLWTNKQFDEAIAVTDAALDAAGSSTGSSLWIDIMHLQSLALHDAKRDDEAISAELEALQFGEALQPANERGLMHLHLADCYRTTEQKALQESEYCKAIQAFEEADNKFFLSQAYIDLGNLQYRERNYSESKQSFEQVIPVLEETQSTDRMPFVKYRLSGIARAQGNPQLALALAEEAVCLSKFVDDVIATRENQIELALVQEALGNYETAKDILDSLIEDNDVQIKNRSAAKAIYCRARVYSKIGDVERSKFDFEKSIPLLKVVDQENLAINAQLALIHIKTAI